MDPSTSFEEGEHSKEKEVRKSSLPRIFKQLNAAFK
jgi:hypothetical protein